MDMVHRVKLVPYLIGRLMSAKGFSCYVGLGPVFHEDTAIQEATKAARCAKKGLTTIRLYRNFRSHPGGGLPAYFRVRMDVRLRDNTLGLEKLALEYSGVSMRDEAHYNIELSENYKAVWLKITNTIQSIRYPQEPS